MKILYFIRDISDCGGIQQTSCLGINSLLQQEGKYQIYVASLFHKYESCFFELDSKAKRFALFDEQVDTLGKFFLIKRAFTKVVNEINPDIIIVQGVAYANYVPNRVWNESKVIVCEHGHFYMGRMFGLHWFGKEKALKRAKAIVTLTELDAENYRRNGRNNVHITTIYNPCIQRDNKSGEYDTSSRCIVSVGSLDSIKRFDHVIKAARIVFSKYPEWKWNIYGDGEERRNLQRLIEENNLQANVFLKGYEKDKRLMFEKKAFLVLTSKFEGFGMVLIEAMQFHLPIISYDVNYGPKEIVENGVNGYLVDNGNINSLASAVEKMMENGHLRNQMAQNAYKSLDKYSLEAISKRWVELFDFLQKDGQ